MGASFDTLYLPCKRASPALAFPCRPAPPGRLPSKVDSTVPHLKGSLSHDRHSCGATTTLPYLAGSPKLRGNPLSTPPDFCPEGEEASPMHQHAHTSYSRVSQLAVGIKARRGGGGLPTSAPRGRSQSLKTAGLRARPTHQHIPQNYSCSHTGGTLCQPVPCRRLQPITADSQTEGQPCPPACPQQSQPIHNR